MTLRHSSLSILACALALGICTLAPASATAQESSSSPLRLVSGRVSLAGTSNIHPFTASTTAVRIVRAQIGRGVLGANVWEEILKPGALEAFEIAIPVATLSSPKEGLDKNMYKALKASEHAEITFRLSGFETAAPGALRARGVLRIAGVEREVTLSLTTDRHESIFTVKGELQLLMTDFGITPPKAMLGMLKTDPKITVTFETAFAVPLT